MAHFLEQAWPFAAAVLVILAIVALAALVIVLVRAAKSMKDVNRITAEAEKEVTPVLKRIDPLVDRAELTVDTVNLELLRVDAILEDVESVTTVAGKAADTVDTITSAPTDAVTSIVDRVRGTLGARHRNKAKQDRFVYPIGEGAKPAKTTTSLEAAAVKAAAAIKDEPKTPEANPAEAKDEQPGQAPAHDDDVQTPRGKHEVRSTREEAPAGQAE